MKRMAAVVLILVLLCLTACRAQPDHRPASTVEQASDYRTLTCRDASTIEWKTARVQHPATATDVRLDIPTDWELVSSGEDTYEIRRSGGYIGTLTTATLPAETELLDNAFMPGDLHKAYQVCCYEERGQQVIYRVFRFVNMQEEQAVCVLYFRILYAQLDDAATETLVTSLAKNHNDQLPPPEQTNGSKQILIAGNSFVYDGFSQIGLFLKDMLLTAHPEYTVTVVCKSGQGLQAFSSDAFYLQRIRAGEFAYVFQCGFYSNDAAHELSVIQEACDASDTKLVIFPAHNEQAPHITTARLGHDRAYFLDWKSEVQAFIDSGKVSRSLLCYDDAHQHSTPLAGYIGAHLIYRSVFREVPPEVVDPTLFSTEHMRSLLGTEYVDRLPEPPVYDETYTIA